LTPQPGGGPFEIRLRITPPPGTVQALNESGGLVSKSPAHVENGVTVISRDPAIFAYRVVK
jgi:hypothetical protein